MIKLNQSKQANGKFILSYRIGFCELLAPQMLYNHEESGKIL